jgi:hypothetical protein
MQIGMGRVFPQRPSGNGLPVEDYPAHSILGGMNCDQRGITWPMYGRGLFLSRMEEGMDFLPRHLWGNFQPMDTDCTTSQEMSGNGLKIGTVLTLIAQLSIDKIQPGRKAAEKK